MHDLIQSWIRTAVPAAVGALIAWLAASGFEVPAEHVEAVVASLTAAITAIYHGIVVMLQRRWPIVGVLLGSTRVPTYAASRSYHPGAHAGRDWERL